MSLDGRKGLQAAERLLKQGKLQAALGELQRVSERSPNDLLTLNRLGDLLARQGRKQEAIGYYRRIAEQFAESGFLPKATAIYKKIIRLAPDDVPTSIALGELYLRQELHGDARSYLLHAADRLLQQHDFAGAREVYATLAHSDADDPRHRLRLAETLALEGNTEGAARELSALGRQLLEADKAAEAEKIFRRAAELHPAEVLIVRGLADSLSAQGNEQGALDLLEQAAQGRSVPPALIGELALAYERHGRSDRAADLLAGDVLGDIPTSHVREIFLLRIEKNRADDLWDAIDPHLRAIEKKKDAQHVMHLLESLADVEDHGHLPALRRLLEVQERSGDPEGCIRTLEWLVQAGLRRGLDGEAAGWMERLRTLAPASSTLRRGAADAPSSEEEDEAAYGFDRAAAVEQTAIDPDGAEAGTGIDAADGPPPIEAEAPAVPLNRGDEEFVAGRVTQAEILEKYGLRAQAVRQLQEVVERFPGHVESQERLVALTRGSEPAEFARVLIGLAKALRASGDPTSAREAAAEAASLADIDPGTRKELAQLGLLSARDVRRPAADAGRDEARAARSPAPDGDFVIDFDHAPEATPVAAVEPVADETVSFEEPVWSSRGTEAAPDSMPDAGSGPASRVREPGTDMLEEIASWVDSGEPREAARRLEALTLLGYASPRMEALAKRVAAAQGPADAPRDRERVAEATDASSRGAVGARADVPAEPPPAAAAASDEDDLAALTAALEVELFEDDDEVLVPRQSTEESLEDIFATFQQHVQQEVGSDDFRTHYDLGIAYKGMGLLEEAVAEFETAARSDEVRWEALSMAALCHRERNEVAESVRCYRKAIAAAAHDPRALASLQYDLGEALLQIGNASEALDVFRSVLDEDPTYRDVKGRVSELEAQLQSP